MNSANPTMPTPPSPVPSPLPASLPAAAPGGIQRAADTGDAAPRQPWREPLVWLVWGIPGLTVVAGLATLAIATQRADVQVTRADYDKSGLAINRRTERDDAARQLGLQARLQLRADGRIDVTLHGDASGLADRLELKLLSASRAGTDQSLVLEPMAPAAPATDGTGPAVRRYAAHVDPASLAGQAWQLALEAPRWRLQPPGAAPLAAGADLALGVPKGTRP